MAALASRLTGTIVERALARRAEAVNLAVEQLSAAEKQSASMTGFDSVFLTYAIAYVVAAICWTMVRQRR